jgi:hypothetical protein
MLKMLPDGRLLLTDVYYHPSEQRGVLYFRNLI